MQTFNKLMLVLLVVAFPMASWYYLNTGLNFRKKALKDLTPKGMLQCEDSTFLKLVDSKTAVIFRDTMYLNDLQIIHDQFIDSKTFTVVQVGEKTDTKRSSWFKYELDEIMADSLFNNNKSIILTDTTSQIRYIYNTNNFEPGRLVEHISIILPREQEPDIKVRQNAGK